MNNAARTPISDTGFQPVLAMSSGNIFKNCAFRYGRVPRTAWKPRSPARSLAIRLLAVLPAFALVGSGCQDNLGTGGSGELVIPRERLRQIEPLDLRDSLATTQPSPR